MALYRNYDQEFDRLLSRPTAERNIHISLHLSATDDGFCLSADGISVSISCEHQIANKSQHENIRQQLSKLGGTIYTCTEVTFDHDFNYFIPNRVLSELRRQLVDALSSRIGVRKNRTIISSGLNKESVVDVPVPHYPYSYLYNISNRLSREFYHANTLSAFEICGGEGPLMQCRHCLRYALGYCLKHGGRRPTWHEPLSLRLGDGRQFRLEFDCKNCQMNVYASR